MSPLQAIMLSKALAWECFVQQVAVDTETQCISFRSSALETTYYECMLALFTDTDFYYCTGAANEAEILEKWQQISSKEDRAEYQKLYQAFFSRLDLLKLFETIWMRPEHLYSLLELKLVALARDKRVHVVQKLSPGHGVRLLCDTHPDCQEEPRVILSEQKHFSACERVDAVASRVIDTRSVAVARQPLEEETPLLAAIAQDGDRDDADTLIQRDQIAEAPRTVAATSTPSSQQRQLVAKAPCVAADTSSPPRPRQRQLEESPPHVSSHPSQEGASRSRSHWTDFFLVSWILTLFRYLGSLIFALFAARTSSTVVE